MTNVLLDNENFLIMKLFNLIVKPIDTFSVNFKTNRYIQLHL